MRARRRSNVAAGWRTASSADCAGALSSWNSCANSQHSLGGQEGHPVALLIGRLLRNVPEARLEKCISYRRNLNKENIGDDSPSEQFHLLLP